MQHRCTKMQILSFPGTRELVETHFAVALGAGMLAAGWLSRRLQRRTDATAISGHQTDRCCSMTTVPS